MNNEEYILDEVAPDYRERFIEIIALIDAFCDKFLNDEYKSVCRNMAVSVCQDDSPVLSGKAASWACGIMYAVGRVNFLTDPSQNPHMKSEEIAKGFGVSSATMHAKCSNLWKGLDLMPLDPEFTIASRIDDNPLIWFLKVNGFMMDIRDAPREAQVVAFENGLTPYIPADRQAGIKST
ncbi:MAG: DUF6398 domain-containing protein [Planctomycetaceae bacterium]